MRNMKKHILVHIRLLQKALMRKRRRSNKVKKLLNGRRRRKSSDKRNSRQYSNQAKIYEAIAPQDFSVNNIAGIVNFIQNTDRYCRQNKISLLKVNLDYVMQIDAFGIALIISMLNKLSFRRIRYWGTYPDNDIAKQVIVDSGFLDLVKTNLQKPEKREIGNQLFMIGKDSVDSRSIGDAVKKAMANILGKESVYPPVYEDMLEISANSVEHANDYRFEKNWLISISVERNVLHFILADTGLGILANLRKKKAQVIRDWFVKNDADVLIDVFNRQYQSITGEVNRHKGLPVIFESFKDGFISDLMVLTNKVMIDFKTCEAKILHKGFNGVLYSWTISIDNYNNWRNSL